MGPYFVYILANHKDGALYIGFTDDLARRVDEHKQGLGSSYTAQYNIHDLVYFEEHPSSSDAFERERQLKKWRRAWKLRLILEHNPEWKDLSLDWQ